MQPSHTRTSHYRTKQSQICHVRLPLMRSNLWCSACIQVPSARRHVPGRHTGTTKLLCHLRATQLASCALCSGGEGAITVAALLLVLVYRSLSLMSLCGYSKENHTVYLPVQVLCCFLCMAQNLYRGPVSALVCLTARPRGAPHGCGRVCMVPRQALYM